MFECETVHLNQPFVTSIYSFRTETAIIKTNRHRLCMHMYKTNPSALTFVVNRSLQPCIEEERQRDHRPLVSGNSSSNFNRAVTFILISSWINSFAAYGMAIFTTDRDDLHR